MKRLLKGAVIRTLSRPLVCRLFSPLTRERATIFMLHRIECRDRNIHGISPRALHDTLAYLRRQGYQFTSVERIFERLLGNGPPLNNAVAFTMDDGFEEQASVGVPIFEQFECPVTLFLITGFIDGHLWPWDSKVEYIFEQTQRPRITCTLGGQTLSYESRQPHERSRAITDFRNRCKRRPAEEVRNGLSHLAEAAGVEVPHAPPPRYRPLSWSEARRLESERVRFGPHTVSHFTLAQLSDAEAHAEISGSWRRLSSELSAPLPVFCFPTGRRCDYSRRDIGLLQAERLKGALTAEPGYAHAARIRSPGDAFQVGRFSFPADRLDLIQYCSWIEQAKQYLRSESAFSPGAAG